MSAFLSVALGGIVFALLKDLSRPWEWPETRSKVGIDKAGGDLIDELRARSRLCVTTRNVSVAHSRMSI